MKQLTKRQAEILAYIVEQIETRGAPPTYREMITRFGWSANNSPRDHLRALERKGYLHRGTGPRALTPRWRWLRSGLPAALCTAAGVELRRVR